MSRTVLILVAVGLALSLLFSILGVGLMVASLFMGFDMGNDTTIDDFNYGNGTFVHVFKDVEPGTLSFDLHYKGSDTNFRFTLTDTKGELKLDVRYDPASPGNTPIKETIKVERGDWTVRVKMDNVRTEITGSITYTSGSSLTPLCVCLFGPVAIVLGTILFLAGIILGGIVLWRGRREKMLARHPEEFVKEGSVNIREEDRGVRGQHRPRVEGPYPPHTGNPHPGYTDTAAGTIVCPRCGAINPLDAPWCMRCGLSRSRPGGR